MKEEITYKEHLLAICQSLYADMVWFTWVAADMAFETDLKYLSNIFDEGEAIPVNVELLASVDDPGVQPLAKWIMLLDETLFSFHNLNLFSVAEIKEQEPDQATSMDETRVVDDKYTETLKLATESLSNMQADILGYMLSLADYNPACSHLSYDYENGASWDIFADTPDQNVNLLYRLFDEAFAIGDALFTIQLNNRERRK